MSSLQLGKQTTLVPLQMIKLQFPHSKEKRIITRLIGGDGNTDSGVAGNISYTHASTDTSTVAISGTFPRIYFNDTSFQQVIGDEQKRAKIRIELTNPVRLENLYLS